MEQAGLGLLIPLIRIPVLGRLGERPFRGPLPPRLINIVFMNQGSTPNATHAGGGEIGTVVSCKTYNNIIVSVVLSFVFVSQPLVFQVTLVYNINPCLTPYLTLFLFLSLLVSFCQSFSHPSSHTLSPYVTLTSFLLLILFVPLLVSATLFSPSLTPFPTLTAYLTLY